MSSPCCGYGVTISVVEQENLSPRRQSMPHRLKRWCIGMSSTCAKIADLQNIPSACTHRLSVISLLTSSQKSIAFLRANSTHRSFETSLLSVAATAPVSVRGFWRQPSARSFAFFSYAAIRR